MPAEPPPVESLIPHRGPMLLLRRVLEVGEGRILCEAAVPAANALARDGRAPGWLAIEAAAQAAAALEALARCDQDPGPRLGYLVGVREARIDAPDFPVETPFRIALRAQGTAPPLAIYETEADLNGARLLTATLSTYVPPD